MTTPFIQTPTLRNALFAALAIVLALGLTACATETEEAEVAEPQTETAEPGAMDTPGGEVTVDETISALQGDITSLAPNMAISNIEGWQQRLQNADFDGASEIESGLGDLMDALQQQPIDGQRVGELLSQLGNQTTQAAAQAEAGASEQLNQLGNILTTAGQQLTGGGM